MIYVSDPSLWIYTAGMKNKRYAFYGLIPYIRGPSGSSIPVNSLPRKECRMIIKV
jgi:hypothetical protein